MKLKDLNPGDTFTKTTGNQPYTLIKKGKTQAKVKALRTGLEMKLYLNNDIVKRKS